MRAGASLGGAISKSPSLSPLCARRPPAVMRIYLDDAGSAPVLREVADAVRDLPDANPSSLHAEGRAARAALDQARDTAARALDADRSEITFTSSGTEAVN